jgi:hypothetical protein
MKKILRSVKEFNLMLSAIKKNEENVFSEGIFLGFFFLIIGILILVVNIYLSNTWLSAIGYTMLAIAGVLLFMVVLISLMQENGGKALLQIWNETVYLFIGLPLTSICLLILPVSFYLLFFKGEPNDILLFCLTFTVVLQVSSLIYSGVKLWLNRRSSGHKLPVKIDKGPIEQLLYKIPSTED